MIWENKESGDLDWLPEITHTKFEEKWAKERDLGRNNMHCMRNEYDFIFREKEEDKEQEQEDEFRT